MNDIYDPTSILDYISQPILFVREGRILHANQAAAIYVEEVTDSIDTLMSQDDVEAYHRYDGIDNMEVVLTLGSYQYGTTIRRQEKWDVFVAYTTPLGQGHQASIMALTGQTMRVALGDILHASMALFPVLEELENPEIQEQTAQMNRELHQLMRLASNLLDGSLFLTQSRAICVQKIDLQEFFGDMFRKIKGYCSEKKISFVSTIKLRIAYGNLDGVLLRRAILNLISNSMKYTSAGGTISVDVEAQNGKLRIQVTDDGEGIPPQMLSSILERYTARPQVGDGRWGVGLGLPMVRYIMKAHGGTMVIAPGKERGTEVILSMPLSNAVSPASLSSPMIPYDETGGMNEYLIELAEILDKDLYDSISAQ